MSTERNAAAQIRTISAARIAALEAEGMSHGDAAAVAMAEAEGASFSIAFAEATRATRRYQITVELAAASSNDALVMARTILNDALAGRDPHFDVLDVTEVKE